MAELSLLSAPAGLSWFPSAAEHSAGGGLSELRETKLTHKVFLLLQLLSPDFSQVVRVLGQGYSSLPGKARAAGALGPRSPRWDIKLPPPSLVKLFCC